MTIQHYRISWISFALAVLLAILIPAVLYFTDDGHPGWDQMSEQLSIIVYGYFLVIFLLSVSFVSGLYVWRQHRVALIWIIPCAIVVLPTTFYLLALLAMYLVAPFWDPGWLMK